MIYTLYFSHAFCISQNFRPSLWSATNYRVNSQNINPVLRKFSKRIHTCFLPNVQFIFFAHGRSGISTLIYRTDYTHSKIASSLWSFPVTRHFRDHSANTRVCCLLKKILRSSESFYFMFCKTFTFECTFCMVTRCLILFYDSDWPLKMRLCVVSKHR